MQGVTMPKLTGNLRITTNPASAQGPPHFEVIFMPYSGRVNSQPVKVGNHDDLVQFLMGIKLSEDDAGRWAGRARSEGVILIPNIERTESQLKESGLLA
jgi:hypothetical protein